MIKSTVWNSGYVGNEHADTSYRNLGATHRSSKSNFY